MEQKLSDTVVFREIARALTSTLSVEEILKLIMDYVGKLYKPDNWSLLLVDEDRDELYFAVAVGLVSGKIEGKRLRMGEGIAGWTAQKRETVVIKDVYSDDRFAHQFDNETGFETESIVCIPMVSKNNTLGVIEIINVSPELIEEKGLQALDVLADFAAIAIENAHYVSRIERLSIHDDWTNLYNARHMYKILDEEIERSEKKGETFSLIFFDMDHLKKVNDAHGHLVGANLLKKVGDLLINLSGPLDRGARYGGDEFVLILPAMGKKGALRMAEKIRDALERAVFFKKEGLNVRVTASFGVATFPDDAKSREEIIRKADEAMYLAKEQSRNAICAAEMIDLA